MTPDAIFYLTAIYVLVFFFGASLASFLGVVLYRSKTGESILGKSHCDCGRELKWYENIPVIGWLRVKGVAKCCGYKLPVSYWYLEIASGALFVCILYIILTYII